MREQSWHTLTISEEQWPKKKLSMQMYIPDGHWFVWMWLGGWVDAGNCVRHPECMCPNCISSPEKSTIKYACCTHPNFSATLEQSVSGRRDKIALMCGHDLTKNIFSSHHSCTRRLEWLAIHVLRSTSSKLLACNVLKENIPCIWRNHHQGICVFVLRSVPILLNLIYGFTTWGAKIENRL